MNYDSIKESNKDHEGVTAPTLKGKDAEIESFVSRRVQEMKDFRTSLKIETKWKSSDVEYEPGDLDGENKDDRRMHFESDEETGLRSRLVPINDADEDWRSRNSDPVLLNKIQTAISIIIDQMPEAKLEPQGKKYQEATAIAYAAWKRNWNISDSKSVYKLFTFNLAKYGWAVGRSYPCRIAYPKEVLIEVDYQNPDNNKYEKSENVWYNDVKKENLNPFKVWIDEQTTPYDDFSTNDWYYEKDYSYDQAKVEFGDYVNFDKYVKPNAGLRFTENTADTVSDQQDDKKIRGDVITIGFYENRLKDLYVIRIPQLKAPLYYSPLPNDDGMLSLWQAPWVLRSATNPYGVSMWEMIKQKKTLYDKMQNMTMDQLVLSIMKMFFYTGTSSLMGDGKIKIQPGKGYQITNGKVDWMQVPGPGKEAFEGLRFLKSGMDDDSAIPPILQGDVMGKTLGEVLHAKEAALKKIKIPVDNIADAIEQDAYVTMSWMAQIYSTPEVKEFADLQQIQAYEQEAGIDRTQLFGKVNPDDGMPQGPFKATYLPEMSLALEEKNGKLVESKKERFFQIGKDIAVGKLYWRGIFKVLPKSIVASSAALEKQQKMELFNITVPLLPQQPEIFAKALNQIYKVNEEDPKDWLPDNWLTVLEQDKQSLFVKSQGGAAPAQPGADAGMGQGVPSNQTSMQGAAGTTPGAEAPTVVPTSQIASPTMPGINAAQRTEMSREM